MLFLTKKTFQARIDEAVAAALAKIPDPKALLRGIRDDLTALRADQAERETEWERELVRRLTAERHIQEAGVQGLLEAVKAVRDRPEPVIPDLAPQIAEATRLAAQALDVATYALESPVPVPEPHHPVLVRTQPPKVGEVLPHFPHGWVRPLGAS
jgi:hypothetical protein